MPKIKFIITTPERTVYDAEVDQISIPTKMGEITVLPHHLPLVSALLPGELKIVSDGKETSIAVSGGFVEVGPEKVTILADSAEHAEEIDEARAEAGRERAKKLLAEKRFDTEEFVGLSAKIEKELARLKVVRKKKYRDLPHQ
ncbi:MAG: ATP synthase F1 subunit epsilon [Patescibacteria group bacterium]|jgi:F-type H+-transporting ATPase subunit epsilon